MLNFLGNRNPTPDNMRKALKGLSGAQVSSLTIENGIVTLVLDVDGPGPHDALKAQAEKRLLAFKGITQAKIIMTSPRKNEPAKKPSAGVHVPVGKIIAVASGKGGVGKSTVAINLAAALSGLGLKIGVLDADIYGPSLPRLTSTRDYKPERENAKMIPAEKFGLKLMSMGYLVDEAAPLVWRGPMVQSALKQLLGDVAWEGCDVLVIDMPPGTGDVQLTLAQQVKIAGAVIVSTPQDIALIDAKKGLEMFRKMNVPILGVVENMSYFCCPNCNTRSDIFGHGGARDAALAAGVQFLGEVPLDGIIRQLSDAGTPIVLEQPESVQAGAFTEIARNIYKTF